MKLQGKWKVESNPYTEDGISMEGCTELEVLEGTNWLRFKDAGGVTRVACGNLMLTAQK